MIFQIKLHPKAVGELTESFQWYEERSEGLGSSFIASVNIRLDEIAEQPDKFEKKRKAILERWLQMFSLTSSSTKYC